MRSATLKVGGEAELALVSGWDVQDGRVTRTKTIAKRKEPSRLIDGTPLAEIYGAIDDAGFLKGLLALETFVALAAMRRANRRHAG